MTSSRQKMEDQTTDKLLAQTLERLKKLEETIQQIQKKLEQTETRQTQKRESENQGEKGREIKEPKKLSPQTILEIDLMNLPDSLRKTIITLAKLGEATPEEVANETNRTRGLENIYLNQLERLGYIEKIKRGKRVYFRSLRII